MNDDEEFAKLHHESNSDTERRLQFCGMMIIAMVVTFVICGGVAVVRMLVGG